MDKELIEKRVKYMESPTYRNYYSYGMKQILNNGNAKFTGLNKHGTCSTWVIQIEEELIRLWGDAKKIDGFEAGEPQEVKVVVVNPEQKSKSNDLDAEGCFGCLFGIFDLFFWFSCIILVLIFSF